MSSAISEDERGRIREIMKGHTYATTHNPNCPSPYLVRIPDGTLDYKAYWETRDFIGWGPTEEEAFKAALSKKEAGREERSVLSLVPSQ